MLSIISIFDHDIPYFFGLLFSFFLRTFIFPFLFGLLFPFFLRTFIFSLDVYSIAVTFWISTIFVFAGLDAAKADELASYKGWWAQFMKDPEDDKELLNVELGNKMVLLMEILRESYLIGDKVLVFSQSLLSLDLIERFLSVAAYDDTYGTWNHG